MTKKTILAGMVVAAAAFLAPRASAERYKGPARGEIVSPLTSAVVAAMERGGHEACPNPLRLDRWGISCYEDGMWKGSSFKWSIDNSGLSAAASSFRIYFQTIKGGWDSFETYVYLVYEPYKKSGESIYSSPGLLTDSEVKLALSAANRSASLGKKSAEIGGRLEKVRF